VTASTVPTQHNLATSPGRTVVKGAGRQPKTAEQRAAKLAEVHAQLADAVAAAATDAGWRAWLGAAARFRSYSPTNQLLILLQRPQATRVAGYRVWQSLDRQVRKGERGITILAPIRRRTPANSEGETPRQESSGQPAGTVQQVTDLSAGESGPHSGQVLVGFTTATVFDLAQTDGAPLPEQPALRLPEGDAPAGLWDGLVGEVESRGFTVTRADCAPAYGVTRYADRRVEIAPDLSPAMACHVLAHELGHIAADHGTRPDVPRGVREAEADGIAYLITRTAGLPGHMSIDYVTGWTGGRPDVVRATAARVVTTAARLLDALGWDPADAAGEGTP
jgi:DNA primase